MLSALSRTVKSQHLPRAAAAGAMLLLAALLVAPAPGLACTNLDSLALLRFYFRGETPGASGGGLCAPPAGGGAAQAWQAGVAAYLRGDEGRAGPLLAAALDGAGPAERTARLDQLLSFAALAGRDDPRRTDLAVELARRYGHSSPIGYMRLAEGYLAQARAGDTANRERAIDLLRLAAATEQTGYLATRQRARAWFSLGEFLNSQDPQQALAAYEAAIAEDTQGLGGTTWNAAVQRARIFARQGQYDQARASLEFAATLPSPYNNYSIARLELARLEAAQRGPAAAITILEEAVAREPAYIPTRLYLAELYRDGGRPEPAAGQYRAILERDPGHAEARAALAELEAGK